MTMTLGHRGGEKVTVPDLAKTPLSNTVPISRSENVISYHRPSSASAYAFPTLLRPSADCGTLIIIKCSKAWSSGLADSYLNFKGQSLQFS